MMKHQPHLRISAYLSRSRTRGQWSYRPAGHKYLEYQHSSDHPSTLHKMVTMTPSLRSWQGSASQPLVKRSVMFLVEFYCTTIKPAPPSFIPQQSSSSSSSKPTPDLTTRQASESTWKSGHVCTSSELLQTNSLHCPL